MIDGFLSDVTNWKEVGIENLELAVGLGFSDDGLVLLNLSDFKQLANIF